MAAGGTYPPLFALKPVAREVWIVDGPEIDFYRMPFPTRMTVVRLASGDLWLHSPIAFSADLLEALQELGPIRHLVAPNWIHYAHLPDWADALPGAETWVAPGVEARAKGRGVTLRVDHRLGDAAPSVWAGEMDQMIVAGSRLHREAVFFHRASRTLILTDLIENFEAAKLPWHLRIVTKVAGNQHPDGSMPRDLRLTYDKDALATAVRRMIAWAPERIVIAHGRWYRGRAVAELRRAFRFLDLDGA
jgi:hypothetical protein